MRFPLDEAMPYCVTINGESVIAESVMRRVAAERGALAKEEHCRASLGEIDQSERKY